jgi:hypothetical protein
MFFAIERKKIIQEQESKVPDDDTRSQGPIKVNVGFANLANIVSTRWWNIDAEYKKEFEEMTRIEKEGYDKDVLRWKLKNVEESFGREESMGQYQGGNDDSNNTERFESIDANFKKLKLEEMERIEKERSNLLEWKLKSEEETVVEISSWPTSNSNEASNSPCATIDEAIAFLRESRASTQALYSHATAHAQSNTIDLTRPSGANDATEFNLPIPSPFNNRECRVNMSAFEHIYISFNAASDYLLGCTDTWPSFAASSYMAERRNSMPVASSMNMYQQQNLSSSLFPSQSFGEMLYGNASDLPGASTSNQSNSTRLWH